MAIGPLLMPAPIQHNLELEDKDDLRARKLSIPGLVNSQYDEIKQIRTALFPAYVMGCNPDPACSS